MNSRQLRHLRETQATARKLREALDNLPPLAWEAFAQACAEGGRPLEGIYELLDGIDERLAEELVNAARKKAP